MRTLLRLIQIILRASGEDIDLMLQILVENLLEVQDLRLAVHDTEHDDTEGGLELGMLIKLVQDDIRVYILSKLDVDLRCGALTGGVVDIRDAVDFLILDQICDIFDDPRTVDEVRKLLHHDAMLSVLHRFDLTYGTKLDLATTCTVGLLDALVAEDDPTGRKIRPRDHLHDILQGRFLILYAIVNDEVHRTDDLPEIMWRDVRRHADRDTSGTVHDQIRELRRQHRRLVVLVGEVRHEVNGVLIDAGEHLTGQL